MKTFMAIREGPECVNVPSSSLEMPRRMSSSTSAPKGKGLRRKVEQEVHCTLPRQKTGSVPNLYVINRCSIFIIGETAIFCDMQSSQCSCEPTATATKQNSSNISSSCCPAAITGCSWAIMEGKRII